MAVRVTVQNCDFRVTPDGGRQWSFIVRFPNGETRSVTGEISFRMTIAVAATECTMTDVVAAYIQRHIARTDPLDKVYRVDEDGHELGELLTLLGNPARR